MDFPLPRDAHRGPAERLQIRDQRRRTWWLLTSALVLVPVAFAGGCIVLAGLDSGPPRYGEVGLFDPMSLFFLAVGFIVLAVMIAAIPWCFTAQEIVVDSHGVLFTQQPMWWFSGRRALIPWSNVKSVATGYVISEGTPMNPATRAFYNTTPDEPRTFVELTLRSAPQAPLPSWVEMVPAHTARGGLPKLNLGPDQLPHQFEQLLRRYRPDLLRTP